MHHMASCLDGSNNCLELGIHWNSLLSFWPFSLWYLGRYFIFNEGDYVQKGRRRYIKKKIISKIYNVNIDCENEVRKLKTMTIEKGEVFSFEN